MLEKLRAKSHRGYTAGKDTVWKRQRKWEEKREYACVRLCVYVCLCLFQFAPEVIAVDFIKCDLEQLVDLSH